MSCVSVSASGSDSDGVVVDADVVVMLAVTRKSRHHLSCFRVPSKPRAGSWLVRIMLGREPGHRGS